MVGNQTMGWLSKTLRKDLLSIEPYRPGKPVSELKREIGLHEIVRLSSNENPWPLSDNVMEAITDGADQPNRYPDPRSYRLRRVLASHWGVSPREILVGAGTEGILHSLFHAIIEPGDEVVTPVPTYPLYRLAAAASGAICVRTLTAEDGSWPLEQVLSVCSEKTKALVLCNPNNPTGNILDRTFLVNLAGELDARGILMVVDEAYAEYVDDPDYLSGIELFRQIGRVVITRTFSKIYGLAGLRVAYAIAPKAIVETYDKIHPLFEVSRTAQRAAIASVEAKGYAESVRLRTVTERTRLAREMTDLGLAVRTTCANFLLVRNDSSELLYESLLREGVIVRNGVDLEMPGYLRVTVGLPEENDRLLNSLKKVLNRFGQ